MKQEIDSREPMKFDAIVAKLQLRPYDHSDFAMRNTPQKKAKAAIGQLWCDRRR